MKIDNFYAHSLEGFPPEKWQPLEEHLKNVAELSAKFAAEFGGEKWAYLAGLWHDLGKYSPSFQAKLLQENNIDSDFKSKGPVIHSEAGGHLAVIKGWPGADRILSWLIMGHHAGLADFETDLTGAKALKAKMQHAEKSLDVFSYVPKWILNQEMPRQPIPKGASPSFFIRMLFSCLVDADFLDTEKFMDSSRSRKRAYNYPSLKRLRDDFMDYMKRLISNAPDTQVNRLRKEVFKKCVEKSLLNPNVFSLTVPTGGGKTLASMAFAINHAVTFGKKRIIYVIPYTNIIEQTADVFRKIPGFEKAVLEHHSNLAEDDREGDKYVHLRLAAENWDAPIIVTTAVQFFESLYSCKSSRCRRLHNIVNSVVIFDEAQCMPSSYLRPIVSAIKELYSFYKVTPLFCTATQPVLTKMKGIDFTFKEGFDKEPIEITDNPIELYETLKRVNFFLHSPGLDPLTMDELAEILNKEESSLLCILNLKDQARELAGLLKAENVFHLSTNMCPAHRRKVLQEIKENLDAGENVKVVSTSLVEAGVDLDFPVVYRALAGIDSIVQAAGRCNREGRLASLGRVVIFKPEKQPDYILQQASLAEEFLRKGLKDIGNPKVMTGYFKRWYWQLGHETLDRHKILELLHGNRLNYYFRSASERFRLIEDRGHVDILVPYGNMLELVARLANEPWNERILIRKLQQYSVSIFFEEFDTLNKKGLVHNIAPRRFPDSLFMLDESLYDEACGVIPLKESTGSEPEGFII